MSVVHQPSDFPELPSHFECLPAEGASPLARQQRALMQLQGSLPCTTLVKESLIFDSQKPGRHCDDTVNIVTDLDESETAISCLESLTSRSEARNLVAAQW